MIALPSMDFFPGVRFAQGFAMSMKHRKRWIRFAPGIAALLALLGGSAIRAAEPAVQAIHTLQPAVATALVPRIERSVPANGESDVPPSHPITLTFNEPMDSASLTSDSVTLVGAEGPVPANVALEGDRRTVSLMPHRDLFPRNRYTVFVRGVSNAHGVPVAFSTVTFTTAALGGASADPRLHVADAPSTGAASTEASAPDAAPVAADPERWLPAAANRGGNWRTGRPLPPSLELRRNEAMAPQSLAPGGVARSARASGAAVSGIVLRQNDRPLANVRVSIGKAATKTDANGEFLLKGAPAGRQELIVDGREAGDGKAVQYGYFVIGIDVQPDRATEVAPIYLPKILASDWIELPSPVTTDTTLTTPLVPGMEIHIPKGAVLRDREGKLVTKVALVPMPLDRVPFPFPENAPAFMSVQPGGMVVQGLTPGMTAGVTVRYPNQTGAEPGTRVRFLAYNTDARGWQIYGEGQVTPDGKQVVPDAGVALYESIGFSYSLNNPPPPDPPLPPCDDGCCGGGAGAGGGDGGGTGSGGDGGGDGSGSGGGSNINAETAGDPVDCKTGLFVLERTDTFVRGISPIILRRTYRPGDTVSRAFGYGGALSYGMYLREVPGTPNRFQQVDLIAPNGAFFRFYRTSSGTSYTGLVAVHNDSASNFYGAVLAFTGTRFVVTKKDGTTYDFGKYGKLEAVRDRHGNAVTVAWSGGQITRLTAGGGRYLDFQYDSANRVTRITDVMGRTWTYTYTSGYLTRVTYPDGLHEDYAYDGSGRMLTLTDRKGTTVVTNVYDTNGRVSQQTLADGAVYQFAYTLDANGKVTQTDVTDPLGRVKRVTYDSHGYKASVTQAYGTSLAQTTTYERDPTSGLVSAVVDPLGRRTELQRDAQGNVLQRTRLAGTADAVIESYTYTSDFNQIASYTDPLGKTTAYAYDAEGNLLSVTDPLSHQRRFTYNSAGQTLTSQDALSNTTRLAYDPTGDLRSITDPLNRTVEYYIDGLGRKVGMVDPLGRKTLWSYDTMGHVVASTDPLGQSTALTYDAVGNWTNLTDPNGGTTRYGYDARNRQTSRTDALGQAETWTYDALGNVLTYEDRKGLATRYEYDALDRRTGATYADGSTVETAYDAGGRLVGVDDSISGAIGRSYDGLDRMVEERTPQGTVVYTFDAAGRRTQMTVASQPPVDYTYDAADRLTSLSQGSETVTFAYDAADRRVAATLPNGVQTQIAYDVASQATRFDYATVQGASLGAIDYAYDEAGQRIGRTQTLPGSSEPLPTATTGPNTFDLNNRQTQANGASLTYDRNGDPLVDASAQPAPVSYTFDARHRLVQMQQSGTTRTSSTTRSAVGSARR